eukprot:CAMPEP_0201537702 /NCGR_PEP_ID=MMETSP0161_2-20130828/65537_1 /ASSEMBLY_ACC=CAM_ASM_000251 /TAXON_ID=180227 /ORGANISM="Neoparamoeba aestuarina, Strain SoJaBio B1-5/56/2" /LENGTH=85 /DNA_ID=CAMNT_0047944153 /DNA_START=32 /DNA_END=289 /DNA_ORIENTATION=+
MALQGSSCIVRKPMDKRSKANKASFRLNSSWLCEKRSANVLEFTTKHFCGEKSVSLCLRGAAGCAIDHIPVKRPIANELTGDSDG